jgi:hypothetical protein
VPFIQAVVEVLVVPRKTVSDVLGDGISFHAISQAYNASLPEENPLLESKVIIAQVS